jgi:2-methylcitrate dehydratase PrpD
MGFQRLVEHLHELASRPLRGSLAEAASKALLDNLGCGLFGAGQPWGRMLGEFVRTEGSSGRATVYGLGATASPARAALANGTATHGFELDDILMGALAHPGAVVVPAALAVAEQHGASGDRLLAGIVAGYEAMGRTAIALGHDHNTRGFHTTGIAGPVGSAVAAAIVLGFDVERILGAVGVACSSAAGIKAFTQGTGGMVKRMHAGRASEAGVLACELTARGFTGPLAAVDGRFGLLEVIGGKYTHPRELDANLGVSYAIDNVWIKVYPCCGLIHSTMHAIEDMKREHRISFPDVRAVRVLSSRRAVEQNGDPDPRDQMTAQYSIPFCAGVAVNADPRSPVPFGIERLDDPRVRSIAARTRLVVDDGMEAAYPARMGAHVELETTSGETLRRTVMDPHGTPDDPCTIDEMHEKFRKLAGAAMSGAAIERIVATVQGLGSAPSVQPLSAALRG